MSDPNSMLVPSGRGWAMRLRLILITLLCLPGLALAQTAGQGDQEPSATETAHSMSAIRLTHVAVDLPSVTLWVSVKDVDKKTVAGFGAESFTVAVDNYPLTINAVTSPILKEPIAWVLLVDCSGSVKQQQFKSMIDAAKKIIDMMGKDDKMMIISFGTDVKVVQDFTNDKTALFAALDPLKPDQKYTKLFVAVREALQYQKRVDANFPARRGILVVTDGEDDGSGISINDLISQDLEPSRGGVRIPILTIGYSHKKGPTFDNLRRLAETSGGLFKEQPDLSEIPKTFEELLNKIQDVYKVQAEWDGYKVDGTVRKVHVAVSSGSVTLHDSREAIFVSSKREDGGAEEVDEGVVEEVSQAESDESIPIPIIAGGALILLVVVIGLALLLRKKKEAEPEPNVSDDDEGGDGEHDGDHDDSSGTDDVGGPGPVRAPGEWGSPAVAPPPKREIVLKVTLVAMEGGGRLEPNETDYPIYEDGTVIGRIGDIKIRGDDLVSSKHCKLTWEGNHLAIRDLDSTNGVFRNGGQVIGVERVESGDILILGRTSIRIYLPE